MKNNKRFTDLQSTTKKYIWNKTKLNLQFILNEIEIDIPHSAGVKQKKV